MRFKWILFFLPLSLFAEIGYVEPWGKDADFSQPSKKVSRTGGIAEKAILFHQNVLTQITGPRSHFRPTSSQYMLEAIREFGFVKGYIMGCDRLLRENGDPWHYRLAKIRNITYKWDPPQE